MELGLSELGHFAEASLFILVFLSGGPRHGYAIMADVAAMTGRPMGPGTLNYAGHELGNRASAPALAGVV